MKLRELMNQRFNASTELLAACMRTSRAQVRNYLAKDTEVAELADGRWVVVNRHTVVVPATPVADKTFVETLSDTIKHLEQLPEDGDWHRATVSVGQFLSGNPYRWAIELLVKTSGDVSVSVDTDESIQMSAARTLRTLLPQGA